MSGNISSAIFKKLSFPRSASHKGDNGRLLIIAGSRKYHGSLVFAIRAAAKVIDLLYILTTPENQRIITKLKENTGVFISVNNLAETLEEVDAVLIGPGMETTKQTKTLVRRILLTKKKAVLDADAVKVLDQGLKKLLHPGVILTPHKGEFVKAFGQAPIGKPASLRASQYQCTIILKGQVDVVVSPSGEVWRNYTGNVGLTKGGTGDILAGLIAAFLCKNEPVIAAVAGVFLNGRAGDDLYETVGPYYDSEDLLEQVPKTLWRLLRLTKFKEERSRD